MNQWTFSPIPEISANFAKIRKFPANQHFLRFLRKLLNVSWNSGQNSSKFCWKMTKFWKFSRKFSKKCKKKSRSFLLKIWDLSGAKECKSCRSRKMLQNAAFLAIVAVHTDENEPSKVRQLDNWVRLFIGSGSLSTGRPTAWASARASLQPSRWVEHSEFDRMSV